MSAYCPQCETDLDPATGICPACRWDPYLAATLQPSVAEPQEQMSLTERYRGTRYDVSASDAEAAAHTTSVSRGRAFVLLSLTLGAGLYMLVMTLMGPIF